MTLDPPPIHPYWVVPGKFLAGPYPGARFYEPDPARKLRYLLAQGASAFFDLTMPGESLSYQAQLEEEAGALGVAAQYHRYGIPDYGVPSEELMVRILDAIDAALAAGQVVYVHCMGGIGRTGTTVACHLARHGLSGEQALARLAELRAGLPAAWTRSPESDAQWAMVLGWPVGK